MALVFASLATGRLPAAKADLYAAVGEVAVKQIVLVCTDASPHACNLYFKKLGGSSRYLIPKNIQMDGANPNLPAQIDALENTLEMSSGDTIEGDCVDADVIDYVITGATA